MKKRPDCTPPVSAKDEPSDKWHASLRTRTRTGTQGGAGIADIRVPGLTVLWHTNPGRIGEVCVLPGLLENQVEISRLSPEFYEEFNGDRNPLADPHLSRNPIRLTSEENGNILLDAEGTSTKFVVDGEPVKGIVRVPMERLERGVVLMLAGRIVLLLHQMDPPVKGLPDESPSLGMVGTSSAILRVKREIARVAEFESPVLLSGASGTGKELAARGIHQLSFRRQNPFFSINMGAIPASLAASELFGAMKGAYSGAEKSRAGFFQMADKGSLFLDEVGETSAEIQAMLLRALDSGEIQQVGAEMPKKVDVRVIAATDKNLQASCEKGEFKAPLYYRLAGYDIQMPPLRDRIEDLGLLLVHFINKELGDSNHGTLVDPGPYGKSWIPASFVSELAMYDWPGNVRQVKNVVRKLVVSSFDSGEAQIGPAIKRLLGDTGADEPDPLHGYRSGTKRVTDGYRNPGDVGEEELVRAMEASRWSLKDAADRLRVSRPSLYNLISASRSLCTAADLEWDEINPVLERLNGDQQAAADELRVSKRALAKRIGELKKRLP